jgi:hypothetical protein
MKMIHLTAKASALLLALLLAASCEKFRATEDVTDTGGKGSLTVSFAFPQESVPQTKAVDTDETSDELKVIRVAALVYSGGSLETYEFSEGDWSPLSTLTMTLDNINPGSKTVRVVVNPPSDFDCTDYTTPAKLDAYKFDIDDEAGSYNLNLQMEGSGSCTVKTGQTASCDVTVTRICARVRLASVKNSAGSDIYLQRAFLTNVPYYFSLSGGDETPSGGYNRQGRTSYTTNNIIDSSSDADMPLLTYQDIKSTVGSGDTYSLTYPEFYCYQNESTDIPAGWVSGKTTIECACLVVVASVGGTTYYYPVVLSADETGGTYGIERNRTYDVYLTIAGPGSDDPNKPVTGVSAKATIKISDWDVAKTNSTYEKSFK